MISKDSVPANSITHVLLLPSSPELAWIGGLASCKRHLSVASLETTKFPAPPIRRLRLREPSKLVEAPEFPHIASRRAPYVAPENGSEANLKMELLHDCQSMCRE